MPPKKEGKEKQVQVKGDEGMTSGPPPSPLSPAITAPGCCTADVQLVLQYLKSVNRPYASTDVSANLKNQVPKTAAQKVLQTLADRGDLTMKQYNKQTIFVYNQDNLPVPSPDELAKLESAHKATAEQVKERKEELRLLEKALPKTKDLPAAVDKLAQENAITVSALAPYRKTDSDEATVQPLTAEEIKVIDADFLEWHKEWKSRNGVYRHFRDMILDNSTQKAEEFEDEQGITVDDDEAIEVFKGEFTKPPARTVTVTSKTVTSKNGAPASTIKPDPSKPISAKAAAVGATVTVTTSKSEAAKGKPVTAATSKKRNSTGTVKSAFKASSSDEDDEDASGLSVEVDDIPQSQTTSVQEASQVHSQGTIATSEEVDSPSSSESSDEPPKKRGRRG